MSIKIPKEPGYYWAKWGIMADGTNYDESLMPHDNWEVVEVFINAIDSKDPEHLMVGVVGVEKAQPLENFFWGDKIKEPE